MDAQEMKKYQEDMKIARMRLEITENVREAMAHIRQYTGSAMRGNGFLMMPGDYCSVQGGCIATARGCGAVLDEGRIETMIRSGKLSHVFNPKDLNGADFSKVAESFLSGMGVQRHWHDASCYKKAAGQDGLEHAVAVYDFVDEAGKPAQVALERAGDAFRVLPYGAAWAAGAMQCSYAEFNPGAVDIAAEMAKGAMDGINKSSAVDKLREHFLDNGRNEVHETQELPDKAEDIPGYDKMSPMEKLRAQDDLAKAKAEREAQAGPAEPEPWGPRMPGQSRYES